MTLKEFTKLAYKGGRGPKFKALKAGRVDLTPEERALVMARKAVQHFHYNRKGKKEATPAVFKSIVNGKTWYTTNTHRSYNVTKTLKGTINRYHDFIKGTA